MCRRRGGLWALALVQALQSSGRLFLSTDGSSDAPGTAGVPSRGRRVGAVLTSQARMRRLPSRQHSAHGTSSGRDAFGEGQQRFCIGTSSRRDAAGSQGYERVTGGWKDYR